MGDLGEERVLHAMGLDDAYHVERVLARGAGGTTELVTMDGSGPFLRKKIPASTANRKVWASLSECTCPRLPQVVATYEIPDEFVVVCSYFVGDTLAQALAAKGKFSVEASLRVVEEVCEAVQDLHVHGVVHCDISPENIVIAADGARLIDLGIARLVGQESNGDAAPLGTWGFAAPEQFGFAKVDERTDVFAISCLLGCLLTGKRPDADDYKEALSDGQMVSPQLRAVVEKGCAFEPSTRFVSASAFVEAAKRAAAGEEELSLSAADPSPLTGFPTLVASAAAAGAESRNGVQPAANAGGQDGMQGAGRLTAKGKRRKVIVAVSVALLLVVVAMLGGSLLGWGPFADFFSLAEGSSATWGGSANAHGSDDDASKVGAGDAASKSSASHQSSSNASLGSPSESGAAAFPGASEEDLGSILSLEETGWFVRDGGYIGYGFAVRNDSSDKAVIGPAVDIVGRDAEGRIISSDCQVIGEIQPGQTLYYGFIAGNGTAPHTVDFSLREPDEIFVRQSAGNPAVLRVTEVREVSDGLGGSNFAGEVTLEDGSYLDGTTQLAVTVVLRDASGDMIGGFTDFAACPKIGSSAAFEIVGGNVPDYASIEAYAQEW